MRTTERASCYYAQVEFKLPEKLFAVLALEMPIAAVSIDELISICLDDSANE